MATIKGRWLFNDTTIYPTNLCTYTENVNFTCNGVTYTGIFFSDDPFSSDAPYVFYYEGIVNDIVWGSHWYNESYKTIDFGETEQTVSDAFLTWVQTNATQVVPKTLKGKWIFNELVNSEQPPYAEYVTFTGGDGYQYDAISLYGGMDLDWCDLAFLGDPHGYYTEHSVYSYLTNTWIMAENRTINFGVIEQEISEEFYTWFTANAKPVFEVLVSYNDNIIASLKAGQTAQLHTKDVYMENDIFVSVPNIEINEVTVPEWDGSYSAVSDVELISFTIGGISYQAEEGMTWGEWVESEYNTVEIFIEAGYVRKDYLIVATNGYGYAKPADTIIANTTYILANGGGQD